MSSITSFQGSPGRTQVVSAWVEPELKRAIADHARQEERTVSSVVRRALREHVQHLERAAAPVRP